MQNFFNIFSEFGGLVEILFFVFGIFAVSANKKFERSKWIRSMYFQPDLEDINRKDTIKFSLSEKLCEYKKHWSLKCFTKINARD